MNSVQPEPEPEPEAEAEPEPEPEAEAEPEAEPEPEPEAIEVSEWSEQSEWNWGCVRWKCIKHVQQVVRPPKQAEQQVVRHYIFFISF